MSKKSNYITTNRSKHYLKCHLIFAQSGFVAYIPPTFRCVGFTIRFINTIFNTANTAVIKTQPIAHNAANSPIGSSVIILLLIYYKESNNSNYHNDYNQISKTCHACMPSLYYILTSMQYACLYLSGISHIDPST